MSANRPSDRLNRVSPDRGTCGLGDSAYVRRGIRMILTWTVCTTSAGWTVSARSSTPRREPIFAADWERRTFRMMIGSLGPLSINGGMFRHSIERMDPAHYLSSPYWEHWLTGVTTLAVEAGVTTQEELDRRAGGHFPLSRPDRGVLPDDLTARTTPRYAVGDVVRVREWHPSGHTRAPRYVQGKQRNHRAGRRRRERARYRGARRRVRHRSALLACGSRPASSGATAAHDGEVVHVDLFERYLQEA